MQKYFKRNFVCIGCKVFPMIRGTHGIYRKESTISTQPIFKIFLHHKNKDKNSFVRLNFLGNIIEYYFYLWFLIVFRWLYRLTRKLREINPKLIQNAAIRRMLYAVMFCSQVNLWWRYLVLIAKLVRLGWVEFEERNRFKNFFGIAWKNRLIALKIVSIKGLYFYWGRNLLKPSILAYIYISLFIY